MPQPRERPVPCIWCSRSTWNFNAVCDRPRCQETAEKVLKSRQERTTRAALKK